MGLSNLKDFLKEKYDIEVKDIVKKKNIYIVKGDDKEYCLKTINYSYSHFKFILSAILHLQKKGFKNIPPILKTKLGMDYIEYDNKYCYLSPWIPSRESNYDNIHELLEVAKKLAELHLCSQGFTIDQDMKPRIYWFKWIENFNVRGKEILDFRNRIYQKAYKSDFDKLYLETMQNQLTIIEKTIDGLKCSNYINRMNKEVIKRGFCHHDYAHHNVLRAYDEELYVIDFDYSILDTNLHDLSSLIIRSMKNGKWSKNKVKEILASYSSINSLEKGDSKIISSFIKFPQQYWQLGIQYYWEQQPWEEDFFLNKLEKYLEDCEEREEFVEDIKQLENGGENI